jgi:hypothetical protein
LRLSVSDAKTRPKSTSPTSTSKSWKHQQEKLHVSNPTNKKRVKKTNNKISDGSVTDTDHSPHQENN